MNAMSRLAHVLSRDEVRRAERHRRLWRYLTALESVGLAGARRALVEETTSLRLCRPEPLLPPLQHSAIERLGVSALYPPHLHGLTQFSERLAMGGGDSLGKLKIPPLALGVSVAEGSLELLPSPSSGLLAR